MFSRYLFIAFPILLRREISLPLLPAHSNSEDRVTWILLPPDYKYFLHFRLNSHAGKRSLYARAIIYFQALLLTKDDKCQ